MAHVWSLGLECDLYLPVRQWNKSFPKEALPPSPPPKTLAVLFLWFYWEPKSKGAAEPSCRWMGALLPAESRRLPGSSWVPFI